MRCIPLICLAALLGSCAAAPQPAMRSPAMQQRLDSLLVNKVAAAPISCLPHYSANDMSVIDGRTVAFRNGSSRTYMMRLSDGCDLLARGGFAMVSRQYGGMGQCSGDIVQVVDTMSRQTVGSCVVEQIVPYSRLPR